MSETLDPPAAAATATATAPTRQTEPAVAAETRHRLTPGTLIACVTAVIVAQVGLGLPAVLTGLFQLDLGTSSIQITWIADAFLVPVTLFELSSGLLGDLFGRKRLLIGGSSLVAIGGIIATLTPGDGSTLSRVWVLYLGYGLAGVGAAALFPTSISMLAAGTHSVRDRSRAISLWAAGLTGAGFLSPVMAGALSEIHHPDGPYAGWRWAFAALAALAVVSVLISLAFARNSSSPAGRSLDLPGQLTIAVALFAVLFAVIQGAGDGWSSVPVVTGFVVGAVFLALFVVVEQRSRSPLVQLDLFGNRAFVVSAVVTLLAMFAYLGTATDTSVRLTAVQGHSPLAASVGFVCLNIMGVLLFPVSARMIERHNPGWTLAAGAGLIGVADLWLAALPATDPSIARIAVPLLIAGAGFKLVVTSITVVALNGTPTNLAGMASGVTSMLRDLGLCLGPAIAAAIALPRAGHLISDKIASDPALGAAVEAFNAAPSQATGAQREQLSAAVDAVNSGPLGANGVPSTVTLPNGQTVPFNPLQHIALDALSSSYSLVFVVCGVAALLAALLAATFLAGRSYVSHVAGSS